jgi:hypothetical protein
MMEARAMPRPKRLGAGASWKINFYKDS